MKIRSLLFAVAFFTADTTIFKDDSADCGLVALVP